MTGRVNGGVASEREYRHRLEVLESDLSHLREAAGGAFQGYEVLRPRDNSYRDGVYLYRAQSLMGSRRDFRTIETETTAPMDVDRLYLLDLDTPTPLELAPLFRIKPGPASEDDACYFYSRIDGSEVRLLSYHFEGEPEIREVDEAVLALIKSLRRRPSQ
jgi:hypothetical protein